MNTPGIYLCCCFVTSLTEYRNYDCYHINSLTESFKNERLSGGSSYGRAKTLESALENCVESVKDWSHLLNFKGCSFVIHVYQLHNDSGNTEEVMWDDAGLHTPDENNEGKYRTIDESTCYAGAVRFNAPEYKGKGEGPSSRSRKFWSEAKAIAKSHKPVKNSNAKG